MFVYLYFLFASQVVTFALPLVYRSQKWIIHPIVAEVAAHRSNMVKRNANVTVLCVPRRDLLRVAMRERFARTIGSPSHTCQRKTFAKHQMSIVYIIQRSLTVQYMTRALF